MSQQLPAETKTTVIKKITSAYRALFAVGILCLFIGGIATAFLSQPGAGIVAVFLIVFGLVYMCLGAMVKRRSMTALIIATILTVLNILSAILTTIQSGSPASIFLPAALLSQLYPAFSAMKELNNQNR